MPRTRNSTFYLSSLNEIFPDVAKPELETSPLKKENWAILWQDNFRKWR